MSLPGLDLETSCLGLGCASLGSRVSRRDGLAGLTRAFDAGVTWYDLAPAYGAGEAETIFADFLETRRSQVQVLTKVGLAPPRAAKMLRVAFPLLRPLLNRARALRKGRTVTQNTTVPITGDLIEQSIARSLRRLRTDHVDVLALHDPDPTHCTRDDVLRALERAVVRGQARGIGIAGSPEACRAGLDPDLPYRLFQTAAGSRGDALAALRAQARRPIATVSHSILRDGECDRSTRLRNALATDPNDVTLVSMFEAAHLAANLAVEREVARELTPTTMSLAS